MSIFHLLSFLAGVVVGSTLSILALSLCLRRREQSTDDEWSFSVDVDAPLTTETKKECHSLNISLDEQPTSSWAALKKDTYSRVRSFDQALQGSESLRALFMEMLDVQTPTGGLLDPHCGVTDALENQGRRKQDQGR